MACGTASLYPGLVRERREYACVGVPPEKEVTPEPRENGAVIAALARILRDLVGAAR